MTCAFAAMAVCRHFNSALVGLAQPTFWRHEFWKRLRDQLVVGVEVGTMRKLSNTTDCWECSPWALNNRSTTGKACWLPSAMKRTLTSLEIPANGTHQWPTLMSDSFSISYFLTKISISVDSVALYKPSLTQQTTGMPHPQEHHTL
jgi:hypothetical protein